MEKYQGLVKDDESIQRVMEPRPSRRWLIGISILLFGIPAIYYLINVRDRPDYILTNQRIIEVNEREIVDAWPYSELKQLQVGQNMFGKTTGAGSYNTESSRRIIPGNHRSEPV